MIDKLEFLIAVASEKSFSRAAEICGVTQPTLSAGVKQLEDSLGVLLVNRSSRFHGLTAEGERVLEWAKRIVGDARAMRQEVRTLREGLCGQLKIAVIPTAEGIVSALTTPYRAKHPHVRFKVVSASSTEVLAMLDNLEIDAGITYLDNEPLGRVRTVPLCSERYRLLTAEGNPLSDRDRVTWADVGRIDLCLLTPDMQNRRIVERLIGANGAELAPILESNSVILLYDHVKSGRWATIMPEKLAKTLGTQPPLRSIPIVEPEAGHEIGLVAPLRDPVIPLVGALVAEAKALAESGSLAD
ncbi:MULTISPECIES: LysR family transcriptional regulator [Methylocystis]|uniref:LysR family transcriptional regulator n=1 Tax=Methylocystis iwaonis TaxID=2885079 RepID=A0ABM8E5X8_9HYPH|nr:MULTISPECIES: LysR family transcriptional regulator [Methylocystis]MBL1257446.1 LysR family transcriptional regulator [Methylocystis sp. Sn-Cys]MDJ0449026.1 LysR family transcriptional regulator [Methylocystis sp. JR02]BDV33371.1 LysR family transcriptional regulator [Methylocystis iwaonis]